MYEELFLLIPLAILVVGTMLVKRYPNRIISNDSHKDESS